MNNNRYFAHETAVIDKDTILQLRLHQRVIALKEKVKTSDKDKKFDIEIKYITSRGNWYHYSWKGDINKSGGIATNKI